MSQLDRLSPLFGESLRQIAEARQAKIKLAQVPPQQQANSKEEAIRRITDLATKFVQRHVNEWLYSMDDQSRNEVEALFNEVMQMSAADLTKIMESNGVSSPFELVGAMMEAEDTSPAVDVANDPGIGEQPEGCEILMIDEPAEQRLSPPQPSEGCGCGIGPK